VRIILTLIIILIGVQSFSQYKKEKIEYFEFKPFERSFIGVDESMDSLNKKPGVEWGFQDSLQFIINIAKIGEHARAYNELKKFHLHDVSNNAAAHIAMIYQLNDRFDLALRWLQNYKPESRHEILAKKMWMDMLDLRQDIKDYKRKSKYADLFYIYDRTSYTEEEKKGEIFEREVLDPLRAGEVILSFHVRYIDNNDPVLAKFAAQMGDVIHQHLSLTMAYVAYSLARNYDKQAEYSKKIKYVKSEIDKENYEIIPLKKFFPKKVKSRFSYEYIKEKKEEEKVQRYKLPAFKEKQEVNIYTTKGFIILVGLALILIFVIFAIKTKKR